MFLRLFVRSFLLFLAYRRLGPSTPSPQTTIAENNATVASREEGKTESSRAFRSSNKVSFTGIVRTVLNFLSCRFGRDDEDDICI